MPETKPARYAMAISLDRCNGCGACMMACAVENNVPAVTGATARTGITWLRVYEVQNGEDFPGTRSAFVPLSCQQCGLEAPCASVCPQNAVQVDRATGIVDQMPQRCLGCRYCMTACPYHARYFNWFDAKWPAGMEKTLNPAVSPRMRGVVEKCNFCHGRLHAAQEQAAIEGRTALRDGDYVPACVEACPTSAIVFGDANDPDSAASRLIRSGKTFRMLEELRTDPKVYYHTERDWVRRAIAQRMDKGTSGQQLPASTERTESEGIHG